MAKRSYRSLLVLGVLLAVLFFWRRVFLDNLLPLIAPPLPQLQCSPTLGRGVAYYAQLSSRAAAVPAPAALAAPSPLPCRTAGAARHCCVVRHLQEGRTGNQLVNYFAGRLYAELHSCAWASVSFGDGLGREGGVALAAEGALWPPAGGEAAWPQLAAPLDATAEPAALRALFERGSAPALVLKAQLERADVLYVAASLAWDLQGHTLAGRGLAGLGAAALKDEATEARCRRWWEEREACWQDAGGRALHPWMPQDLRALAVRAMRWAEAERAAEAAAGAAGSGGGGSSSYEQQQQQQQQQQRRSGEDSVALEKEAALARAAAAALLGGGGEGSGGAPLLPPGLRAVAADPEGTLVIHARLGDMSAMAWQEALANAAAGHDATWDEAAGGAGWQWVQERFPGYRYPQYPDCDKLAGEAAYSDAGGAGMLEALEWDAARLGGFVVSPLSFYAGVIEGSAAAAGAPWRSIVVLTEPCSVSHPIVRALVARYGAAVQAGSVAEDLATMALARTLVISSSTFSLMAALLGRARAIHVPYAGSFSLRSSHNRQCLTPSARLDPRFVFHDVYRRAVDAAAAALGSGAAARGREGQWLWRAEGHGALPVRPPSCPPSNASLPGGLGYGFLSWAALEGFYHRPGCAAYYYPPRDAAERAASAAYIQQHARHPLCTDTEWTLYTGAAKEGSGSGGAALDHA